MQIMVRTRGFDQALGRAIGKVLGRRDESDVDAPSGEGLLHQPIDSDNNRLLSSTLLRPRRNWSTTSQKHLLKKVLLMLRVFQADPMTHQFWVILKITLLWECGMERYVSFKKLKERSLLFNYYFYIIPNIVCRNVLSWSYLPMEGRWLSSGGRLQRLKALWMLAD